MKVSTAIRTTMLALGVLSAKAGIVDHFAFSPIASPQRLAAPFPVTVTALDSNGVTVTNFSGPVQLFFTTNFFPAYYEAFPYGFPFDTDGDGTSDGAEWRIISGNGIYSGTRGVALKSKTVYSLSLDCAVNPSGPSDLLFSLDAVLYSGINPIQLGAWGGWFPANRVSRFSAYSEFGVGDEDANGLMLRYWLPLGGSASIYTDNIKIRVRDVSPGFVIFSGGQWTGNPEPFLDGTNLTLRAFNNNGQSGDSNPFDILPRMADVSVTLLPHDFLPAGQQASINFMISNAGPSSIEGVIVTNELPADITLIQTIPYGGSKVESNRIVTYLPPVPGQSAMTLSLIVQRDQAGPAPVTATLAVPDYDTNASNQSASDNVIFVPVLTAADVTVTERPGGTNATFKFQLSVPAIQEFAVNLSVVPVSARPGSDYTPLAPDQIVFLSGHTQAWLVVPVLDDVFHESPEQFSVVLSLTNQTPVLLTQTDITATIQDDDPLPTVTVGLPASAPETSGTLTGAGSLQISAPFEEDIEISLVSSDQTEILSPGALVLPAGQTNATFNLTLVDDLIYDPNQTVTITANCTNGMVGSAQMVVLDNDLPNLTVTVSFKPAEGNGTVTNAIRITSPVALDTNLTISLLSSDTSEMLVPSSVLLLAGRTFTNISATVVDDAETDGPQTVTITANAPGFTQGSITLTVSDNDLHHFAIGGGEGQVFGQPTLIRNQTSTVPFTVSVFAKDINSNTLSGFTQAVALSALGDLGPVVLSPTNTGILQRGSWFGTMTVSNGDHTNVRIIATDVGSGRSGQSNPFRVYATAAQQLRILGAGIGGNDVWVTFNSVTGRHYRLEAASDLTNPAWNIILPNVTGLGGAMSVTNAGGFTAPRRFYRMVLQP